MIDAYDYQLLLDQAFGQLATVVGYLYSYVSTIYGLQILNNKYSPNREELVDPDPDVPALAGAEILIIAQVALLHVSQGQYAHFYDNFDKKDLNAAKDATYEIYLGDFLDLMAYIFGYLGIQEIYNIDHATDPTNPVME